MATFTTVTGAGLSVTYDGNGSTGGAVPIDSTSYETGQTVTVLDNTGNLVKEGNSFVGWNTEAGGGGTTYTVGQAFAMGTSDVILYARWTTNPTYTVTYDGNGNTGGVAPADLTNYETGQTVMVLGNTGNLVKAGNTFVGWNTEAGGGGTTYAAGQTFAMGASDVTLYARWTTNPTYTVTYDGNGSTGGDAPVDANDYEQGDTVTVLGEGTLVRVGYDFSEWNTAADGSGTSYDAGDTFEMGAANRTLFAIWEAVYALRDVGPAGGLIFYINPDYIADGWRYMEAAPAATEPALAKQWGTEGTAVGGTGTAIGAGPNNTALVAAAIRGGGGSLDRAAVLCDDLVVGIYSDWFLPSQDELNEMYEELYLFGVGGFTAIGYWSSSEFSSANAWRQTFATGAKSNNPKVNTYRVRAVRRF